jgi:hypothetical protein
MVALAETFQSLGRVYLPPWYEKFSKRFPVICYKHGTWGDSDRSPEHIIPASDLTGFTSGIRVLNIDKNCFFSDINNPTNISIL